MNLKAVLFLLFLSPSCFAGDIKTFQEAWDYLSAQGKPERWVVVSSPTNDGYFQCSNQGIAVRCDMPIWVKAKPDSPRLINYREERLHPHTDVLGSELKRYLSNEQVESASLLLRQNELKPYLTYSQLQTSYGTVVGTSCDLHVVLHFQSNQFEQVAKDFLRVVFGADSKRGYTFLSDS